MPVATGDAFRYITTTGTNVGESDATLIAPDSKGTLTIAGGFGITLTADAANRKITITNTGNGTGALTTITTQNSAGIYYPIFTRAPTGGDYNPNSGTYQMSTMYYETTTDPLTYNPGTGLLSTVGLSLSGTLTINGVTNTGTTGTGNIVYSSSPTITSPQILTNALVGPTASANISRFPNALAVVSNTASGIQQNEPGNIGIIAEATGIATIGRNAGVYGVGYTAGTYAAGGVIGEAHVSATGDATSAVGVRGYSQDTHSGGMNIGLYGNASGGSSNYALYMGGGDIYNNGGAQTWTMTGNLTFSGAYTVTIPTLNLTNALGVSYGGTGTGTAGITAFNNITGYTASGATGTTSTNLVFSTSPTLTTPNIGAATATSINKVAFTSVATGATITATDGTTITLPTTTGTVALNNQTMYIGTTSVAINRSSANLALTGITSIDGTASKATNIVGGNNTILLGSLPYQSNTDTTTLLSPNTSATKKFLRQTGDGTNGAAPAWDTLVASDIPSSLTSTTGIGSTSAATTVTVGGAYTGNILKVASTANGTINLTTDVTTGTANLFIQVAGGINIGAMTGSLITSSTIYSNDTSATVYNTNATTVNAFGAATTLNLGASGGTTTIAGHVKLEGVTSTGATGTGNLVFGTNPSLTAPTWGNSSNTTDADYTFDASLYGYSSWIVSFTAARSLNISNLTTGRRAVIYIRNTNASSRLITINASTTATGFTGVNLAVGAGAASSTSITLVATSGTAVVYVWNAGGTIVGMVN